MGIVRDRGPRVTNPFKIVDSQDGPVQEGRLSESAVPEFGPDGVETVICVRDGDSGVHEVMKLSGVLWNPAPGSVIELGEPNRDARVLSQVFMVVPGKVASVVCVADPATAHSEG